MTVSERLWTISFSPREWPTIEGFLGVLSFCGKNDQGRYAIGIETNSPFKPELKKRVVKKASTVPRVPLLREE
jgi:hypothetical protein